jgi:hypothetical protein
MATLKRKRATKVDVNEELRAIEVFKLRAQHVPFREIAQRLGFSGPSGAHAAMKRELAKEVHESVEEMRDGVGAAYDEALRWLHEQIYKPGTDPQTVVWYMDRQACYLSQKTALYGLALGEEERKAATGYTKRIVIEESGLPLQLPGPGETTYDADGAG